MREPTDKEDGVFQAATQQTMVPESVDLSRLYRDHASLVYRSAYRITGSSEDAEDVLQTVFLRLVRRREGQTLSADPSHYLRRAAINAALDICRSKRNARSQPMETVEATLADRAEDSPGAIHDSRELSAVVRRALAEVSPRSAEVFILRYFEGYDNHEIARLTGASRSTVGVILHRTRQHLRELLGPLVGERS